VNRPMFRIATVVACLLALFATASPAQASTRNKIIKDCADDGVLQGSYSAAALRDARQHLPSDVAEYTDCADVLRRAEIPPSTGGGGGGGGTGATGSGVDPTAAAAGAGGGTLHTPQTDADRKALSDAAVAGSQPVKINGESIVPGAAGLRAGATRNGIPGTLVIALVLLSFAGGALTIPAVRRGIPVLVSRIRRS
jgi:hypothetical protein